MLWPTPNYSQKKIYRSGINNLLLKIKLFNVIFYNNKLLSKSPLKWKIILFYEFILIFMILKF